MPRRDGTGPIGKGAETGRCLGNCDKAIAPFITRAIAGIFMGIARKNRFGQKGNNQDLNCSQKQGQGFGRGQNRK